MEHVEGDQFILPSEKKQACESISETTENQEGSIENTKQTSYISSYSFSIEDIKKYQSDSSLVMSDCSEGNSCEIDSEKEPKIQRQTRRTLLETDFPKYRRSKSNVFKKTFLIEDVVNEEMYEDDCDSLIPMRKKKLNNVNINYTDEIPVLSRLKLEEARSAKSLQLDAPPKRSSEFGRINLPTGSIAPMMATVPESQEDEKADVKSNILLQSPRIKITSDFKEDACIASGSPRTNYFAVGYHPGKNYSIENEAIAEDNNENIVEKKEGRYHCKKKDSICKFETFIDKEEPVIIDQTCEEEGNFKFETIKEENAEEDVVVERSLNKSSRNLTRLDNICADEVDVGVEKPNSMQIIKAVITAEEAINELDGEDEK